MLAKEDLLVCKTPPNIRDVSLHLYKEFAETYLKNAGSGRNTLNSNDFKIPAFYQAWCDNTQGNDQISNWLNSLMAALGGTDEKVSEPA